MNLGRPLGRVEKFFAAPPGIWFNGTAVLLSLLTIASVSGPGVYFKLAYLSAHLWMTLGAVWLTRIVIAAGIALARRRHGVPADRTVFRWGFSPSVLVLSFLTAMSGLPAWIALCLSRSAMDRLAFEWAKNPVSIPQRGWIGLYPVESIETLPGGVRFTVSDTGFFSREGFAYFESGAPPTKGGSYKPIGGSWFRWSDEFLD